MRLSRRHIISTSALTAIALTGCGNDSDGGGTSAGGSKKVVVGASPLPHAKILEHLRDHLAKDAGLEIEVKEFDDYVLPNEALAAKEIDANYFQHLPYLDNQIKEKGYTFDHGTGIHIEPFALFSKKHTSAEAVPEGGVVAITNDPSNQYRGLKLLESVGLLSGVAEEDSVLTLDDAKNPRKLKFEEAQPELVVKQLEDPSIDLALINGNFILTAGLRTADALVAEKVEGNPYANLLVWRKDDASEAVKKLDELLHSKEVAEFIKKTWPSGDVLPGESA